MRPKSLKFHGIALGTITLVTVLLYLLMAPKEVAQVDPNKPIDDRYVRILDASWGLNCNTEIARLIRMGKTTIGEGENAIQLQPVQPNNATFVATEFCTDRVACDIPANNDTMKFDPLPNCYKELTVAYRCFSIDRRWSKTVDQGQTLTIDCHAGVDQAEKPKEQ